MRRRGRGARPSASRASTSSSSMACSRRAPSSLSRTRWWSRSPSTARRMPRWSQPRSGSSATAANAVSRTALTGSSRSKSRSAGAATAMPYSTAINVDDDRTTSRARSASATSNAPYRRMPWMRAAGTASMLEHRRADMTPTGRVPEAELRGQLHSTSQLPIQTSTVQAMTRTRARVRSSPVKARLTRTSRPSDAENQGLDDQTRRPAVPPTRATGRPRGSRSPPRGRDTAAAPRGVS